MFSNSILLSILYVLSAFFSGSETSLFSLSRVYLKKLENSEDIAGKRVLKLLAKPRRLLITLLLGNTFVNIAISSISTLITIEMATANGWDIPIAVTIQIIATTLLILVFGEIVPKLLALSIANEACLILSIPVTIIQIVLYPFVWVFEKISNINAKKHPLDKQLNNQFTQEEFHNLIQSESSTGSLEEHERKMLVGLFRFREAEISEIYVPRVRICAIEENQTFEDLIELIVTSGYSRIPVFRDNIDDVIGIIYVKDIILHPVKKCITDLMRPAWFVTENMKIQSLLNQFKQKKLQVAIVVDEYGGTSGIITLEDILEEIVGEIQDEYDTDETPQFVKQEDGTCIVSGNFSVRQFNQEFGCDISVDEFDNMAEFLLAHFNHVPKVSETFVHEEFFEFRVLESDEKSIKQIEVRNLNPSL